MVSLVATADVGYRFVKWTGDVATIADVNVSSVTITMDDNWSITANSRLEYTPMIAAGDWHMTGLKSDGTMVAVGLNYYGQYNVGDGTFIEFSGLAGPTGLLLSGYGKRGYCIVTMAR